MGESLGEGVFEERDEVVDVVGGAGEQDSLLNVLT